MLGLSDQHERLTAVAGYILAHKLTGALTNRDVQRGVRTMRGLDRRDVESIFDQLNALGWLIREPGRKFSDPPKWIVNEEVHVRFEEQAELEVEERQRAMELMVTSISEHKASEIEIARHPSGYVLSAHPSKLKNRYPWLQLKLMRPGTIAKRRGERNRVWLKFNTDTRDLEGEAKAKLAAEPEDIQDWVFDVLQGWKVFE